jgi:hypothetical protein
MDRFVHTGPKFKVNISKSTVPTKPKKFPIKTLLEMRDSSIKTPGEAEYVKKKLAPTSKN